MPTSPQLIYPGRSELAEGPVWFEGSLWWVNIAVGTLNRLDVETGINTSRGTGGFLGAAVPCTDGRWMLARQHDCALLDWETGRFTPFAAPKEGIATKHRFNDGKCDPRGRFWVGTLSLDGAKNEASLFFVEASGAMRRVLNPLSLSNGMAWSPKGDRFYHIDTPTRRISVFDYDVTTGGLSAGKTLIQFSDTDGFPDGMTVDVAGNLWVALWGGSGVVRIDGQTGATLTRFSLPVSRVSSCTFGGPDLRTLYITTAWEGATLDQRCSEPLAGSIFSLRTDTQGFPVTKFAI